MIYPIASRNGRWFTKTKEFRKPLKGEFFLSGAIPEVYLAGNDLGMAYCICKEYTLGSNEIVYGGKLYREVR